MKGSFSLLPMLLSDNGGKNIEMFVFLVGNMYV